MDSKSNAQHPADTVPTNVTKPVTHMTPDRLEQNTGLEKFSTPAKSDGAQVPGGN